MDLGRSDGAVSTVGGGAVSRRVDPPPTRAAYAIHRSRFCLDVDHTGIMSRKVDLAEHSACNGPRRLLVFRKADPTSGGGEKNPPPPSGELDPFKQHSPSLGS